MADWVSVVLSSMPRMWRASCRAIVYKSYCPWPLMPKLYPLFSSMSPDQVVPDQEKGEAVDTAEGVKGFDAMRMSPKRESPSRAPVVPRGWPSSATTPMFTLVFTAQVWNARRISFSQAAVEAWELSRLKRLLGVPPALVRSGAKLRVRCPGSGQGWPKILGVRRLSNSSRSSELLLRIKTA